MEEYFEKGDVSVETLKRCIKRGTIAGTFRPVLCGTAFKNKGVQPLLDARARLPAEPDRRPRHQGRRRGRRGRDRRAPGHPGRPETRPFAGLAFKIINDKYGNLTFVRVYAGTLKPGDTVLNTTKGHKERIGRMFQMHADKREEIKEVDRRRHRRLRRAEGHRHRRHAGRPAETRSSWSAWPSRSRSSTSRSSRRPRTASRR